MPICLVFMDFASLPLFNVMKMKLNYLSARQEVLAKNIANADTPDYKARDVSAPDFSKVLAGTPGHSAQNLPMATTHTGHIAMSNNHGGVMVIEREKTDELNPNGNNVSIEEEMSKVAANQGQYAMALNIYSKTISMFKTAIGNPSGG